MFPINGRPLGPGGYGDLDLLRESRDLRYLASAIRETAAPRGMARRESIFVSSSMMRRVGEEREPGGFPSQYPCLYTGGICGESIKPFAEPDDELSVHR